MNEEEPSRAPRSSHAISRFDRVKTALTFRTIGSQFRYGHVSAMDWWPDAGGGISSNDALCLGGLATGSEI